MTFSFIQHLQSVIKESHLNSVQSHEDFYKEAELVLRSFQLEQYSLETVLNYANTLDAQKIKHFSDDEFSDIPITIYNHGNTICDLYIWDRKKTYIHNHNFIGVYTILEGYATHRAFEYDQELKHTSTVLLQPGTFHRIKDREEGIHQLSFLTFPTVILCIRTQEDPKQKIYLYDREHKLEASSNSESIVSQNYFH